jgi:two-component system, OmpR family, response regulator
LADPHFQISICSSFQELADLFNTLHFPAFDLIILDRLLHGHDSADLMGHIRTSLPTVKIMILSALDTAHEKANLLNLGADDYLAKPFEPEELIARVNVLLRRNSTELRLGNLALDGESRMIRVDSHEISLQNREFILLRTLVKTPRKVYSKAELYSEAWDMSANVESNVIETTVNKLRRRLEEIGATVSIKSMRNKGYWVEE